MNTLKEKIRGNVFAPVRFYMPFPHHLLSAVELRLFILFTTKMSLSYRISFRWNLPCSHSPRARLCRVPSAVIRGRLNLPMSLNPSPLISNNTIDKVRCSFLQ
jgi:hypothetical protein